jgi:hypothetical protein
VAKGKTEKDWHLWGFFGLLLLSLAVRYPLLGTLNFGHYHEMSASVLNYAGNWFDEGYSQLHGMLYNQPRASEFGEINSRDVYRTQYSLFVLPVYFIAKLSSHFPEPWMINLWNFILHGFTALLVGLLAYGFTYELKEKYRRWAFLSASFCCLFSSQLLYFFSAVYWSDQFALPLIAAVLLLEQRIDAAPKQLKLVSIQQVLIGLAVLSSWYGLVFGIFLLGYNLVRKNWVRVVHVATGVGLACLIIGSYFYRVRAWGLMKIYILDALSFTGNDGDKTKGQMLNYIFVDHLGLFSLLFVFAFFIAYQMQEKKRFPFKYIVMFFIAPLVFTYFFLQGTYTDEFTVLKFYIPILVFFAGVFPVQIWAGAKKNNLFKAAAFAPAAITVAFLAYNYNSLLMKNNFGRSEMERLQWIKRISQPEQVLFSNEIYINIVPSQGPYVLRKNIWTFNDVQGLTIWKNIFRDSNDYPMLWLEKRNANTDACIPFYKKLGATEVSKYEDIQAFLFSSIRVFAESKDPQLAKCL